MLKSYCIFSVFLVLYKYSLKCGFYTLKNTGAAVPHRKKRKEVHKHEF